MVKKYVKKPVVIEAVQYNNLNKEEIEEFVGKKLDEEVDSYHYDEGLPIPPHRCLFIDTLEGRMTISPNDYVIKGVNGEFYPCKPDVFQKTYDHLLSDNLTESEARLALKKGGASDAVIDRVIKSLE